MCFFAYCYLKQFFYFVFFKYFLNVFFSIASGVDILVAIGHSGYERDQDIARGVPDIDLVVGGHSHSFLYSGNHAYGIKRAEDKSSIFYL